MPDPGIRQGTPRLPCKAPMVTAPHTPLTNNCCRGEVQTVEDLTAGARAQVVLDLQVGLLSVFQNFHKEFVID